MNCIEFGNIRGRNKNFRGRGAKAVNVQRAITGRSRKSSTKKTTSTNLGSSVSSIRWKNTSVNNITYTVTRSSSSKTYISSDADSRVIVAIAAGRGEATCEIGLAVIDIYKPTLILCQISDMPSYVNTLTKINILNPHEILLPMTFVDTPSSNRLVNKIKEHFKNITITAVPRLTYNKSTGMELIKELCASQWDSILLALQHKYYCLTAASALLTYTESVLYVIFNKKSLKVEYQESEGYCIIDVSTADSLELVASNSETANEKYSSLYGILNYCFTKIGARTLRATILQPPCSVPDIEARLDCIMELKKNSNMMIAVQTILPKISNIDQLLSLATLPSDHGDNFSDKHLTYVLTLNALLDMLEPLKDVFEESEQPFFKELKSTLENDFFKQLMTAMRSLIQPDAHPAKGQRGLVEKCFIIKPGVNGLLDVLRRTYSERVEDLKEYVNKLRDKYNLPLTLGNNHKKGYHIVLQLNTQTKKTFKKSDLPDEFVQVDRLFSSVTMKTTNLMNLAVRIEDILLGILKMNGVMVYQILVEVRNHIGLFYKLCEEIAKLDMIQSLAQASSGIGYTRAEFGEYLEVTNSRHPLLDFLCSTEPVSNSIFASREHNVHIITGPNGSGKSVFIRQVFLLQVMAQVGCFIPAEKATFRVCDRMLARIYFEDNMNCGASSFVLEVKEIQYFHTVMTSNTLIIIDELCRSTAIGEGTALAMAMVESLAKSQALVFLATHYIFVTKLEEFYTNVTNWQMESIEEVNERVILHFTYNLKPDSTILKKYGLCAARAAWAQDIVEDAERLYDEIEPPKDLAKVRGLNVADRLIYNLEAELKMLKMKRILTATALIDRIRCYAHNLKSIGIDITKYLPPNAFEDDPNVNAAHDRIAIPNLNWSNANRNDSYASDMLMYPEVVYSPSNINPESDLLDYDQFCQHIEAKNSGAILQCTSRDSYADQNDAIMSHIMSQNINKLVIENQQNRHNIPVEIPSHIRDFENASFVPLTCPNDTSSNRNIIQFTSDSCLDNVNFKMPNEPIDLGGTSSVSQNYLNEDANTNSVPWTSKSSSSNADFAIPNQRRKSVHSNSIPWASTSFQSSHVYPKSENKNCTSKNNTMFDQDLTNVTHNGNATKRKSLGNPEYLEDADVASAIQDLNECSTYFTQEWDDTDVKSAIQDLTECSAYFTQEWDDLDGAMPKAPQLERHNDLEDIIHKSPTKIIKDSDEYYMKPKEKKSNVIVHSVHIFDQNNDLVEVQKFHHKGDDLRQEVAANIKKELTQSQISGNNLFEECNETYPEEQCTMDLSEQNSGSISGEVKEGSFTSPVIEPLFGSCSTNHFRNDQNQIQKGAFNAKRFESNFKCDQDIKHQEFSVNKISKNTNILNKATSFRKQSSSLSEQFFKLHMRQDLSKIPNANEIIKTTDGVSDDTLEISITDNTYEILDRHNNHRDNDGSNGTVSRRNLNFTEETQPTCIATAQEDTSKNLWFSTHGREDFNFGHCNEQFHDSNTADVKKSSHFNFDNNSSPRNTHTSSNNIWLPVLSNRKYTNQSCGDSNKIASKSHETNGPKSFCTTFFEIRAKKDALRIQEDYEKSKMIHKSMEESIDDEKYFSASSMSKQTQSSQMRSRIFTCSGKTNFEPHPVSHSSIKRNGKYSLMNCKDDGKKVFANNVIENNASREKTTSHINKFDSVSNAEEISAKKKEELDTKVTSLENRQNGTLCEPKMEINEDNEIKSNKMNDKQTNYRETDDVNHNVVDISLDLSKRSVTSKSILEDNESKTVYEEHSRTEIDLRSVNSSKNATQQAHTLKIDDTTNAEEVIHHPCSCASTLVLNNDLIKDKQSIQLIKNDRRIHVSEQDEKVNEELEKNGSNYLETSKYDVPNRSTENEIGELNKSVYSCASTLIFKNERLTTTPNKHSQMSQPLRKTSQHSMKSLNRYFEKSKEKSINNQSVIVKEGTATASTKTFNLGGSTSKSIFETSCMSESLFGSSPEDYFSAVDEAAGPSTSIVSSPKKLKVSDASPKVVKKSSKKKFKTPMKTNKSKPSPEKKLKTKVVVRKPSRTAKFIPPKALSKKEILEDFEKQRRKLLENSDDPDQIEKYMKFIANMPNVEQIQAQKYLAFIKKTNDGIVVIPATTPTVKRKKIVPLKRKLSATEFDKTMLSDKNEIKLRNLLQTEKKIFDFDKAQNDNLFGDYDDSKKESNFQLNKTNSSQTSVAHVLFDLNSNDSKVNSHTPKGYYTQNRNVIDDLIKKYQ